MKKKPDKKFYIPSKDVPNAVLDSVAENLTQFLVPIAVVDESSSIPNIQLIGSGTLVKIDDEYFILTATHIWDATQHAEQIFLNLTTRGPTAFYVTRNYISPRMQWHPKSEEWGPDLVLLNLPARDAETVSAFKSFLNLRRQRESVGKTLPDPKTSYWAITGVVEEFTRTVTDEKNKVVSSNFVGRAFFSGVDKVQSRSNFDFVDLRANLRLSGVPKSFGGVSGGGLWNIRLRQNKKGEIEWDKSRRFFGVVYWQSADVGDRRLLRAHGPRSLYGRAWDELEANASGG